MNTRHGCARQDENKAELWPLIVLTTADRDKLLALIRELPVPARARTVNTLEEEVRRAHAATGDVSPTSVVRIGSDVKFIDHDDGRVRRT